MTQSLAMTLELYPGTTLAAFDSDALTPIYRVEMADGRHYQINETLFRLLDCLRTPMSLDSLQRKFTSHQAYNIPTAEIEAISAQLLAQGILVQDGVVPPATARREDGGSIMALHYRRELFSAKTLAPIVRPFQIFFTRPVAALMAILIAAVHTLTYIQNDFSLQLDMTAVHWPFFMVILLATIFVHEMGHLAACQRWQCPHGPLGIGFYFFNPIFYVDVTAAWRLNRWQRATVDLAGVYLQLVATIPFWLLWRATGDTTWLSAILITDFFVISNLQPFIKVDGYWLLSDLSGVPNLHTRMGDSIRFLAKRMFALIGIRGMTPVPSPFMQWSTATRWTIGIYTALSLILLPMTILGLAPMVVQIVTTYPALWQEALTGLPALLAQGNLLGALQQLQMLLVPTWILANLLLILSPVAKKVISSKLSSP